MSVDSQLGASFRDPSGFVYRRDGVLLRQVNPSYRDSLNLLTNSGLYGDLTAQGLLISHTEVDLDLAHTTDAVAVLRPEIVQTVSYPYEWSFSQLKDAALATLKIQAVALDHGMTLKDASAFNILFHEGRPVLIDSLSFEPYQVGKPWKPYRQFCQHFLAPLVLMSYVDVRLGRLSETYIDGIPLDLASKISSKHTGFNPQLSLHLHLHAKMQAKAASAKPPQEGKREMGKNALLGWLDSLRGVVDKLKWKPEGTEWGDYYSETNYSEASMSDKHRLVGDYLDATKPASFPATAWDLGANVGEFSSLATARGFNTVAWDIDPAAVEKNYLAHRSDPLMLPLLQDLTNPSPSIGWNLRERDSFLERGPAHVVMALALVHHLAVGNNVPLNQIASFLRGLTDWLVIEFVPKEDSQVQRLLSTREDVFPNYRQPAFEQAFSQEFEIVRREQVSGTARTLFLMRAR